MSTPFPTKPEHVLPPPLEFDDQDHQEDSLEQLDYNSAVDPSSSQSSFLDHCHHGNEPLTTATRTTVKLVVSSASRDSDLDSAASSGAAAAPYPETRESSSSSSSSSPIVVSNGPSSSPNVVSLALDGLPLSLQSSSSSTSPPVSLNSQGTVVRHMDAASPWARSLSPEPFYYSTPTPAQSAVASSRRTTPRDGQSSSIDGAGFLRSSDSWEGPSSTVQSVSDSSLGLGYQDDSHLTSVASQPSERSTQRSFSPVTERPESRLSGVYRPQHALVRHQAAPKSSLWLVSGSDSDGGDGDERLDSLSVLRGGNSGDPRTTTAITTTTFYHPSSASRCSSPHSARRPGTGSSFLLHNALPAWAKVYYRSGGHAINSTLSIPESVLPQRPPSSSPSSVRTPTAAGPSDFQAGFYHHHQNNNNNSYYYYNHPRRPETAASQMRPSRRQYLPWNWGLAGLTTSKDPRDPRSHWVSGPPAMDDEITVPDSAAESRTRYTWSPHLFPDRTRLLRSQHRHQHQPSAAITTSTSISTLRNLWSPPSIDSRTEPVFGRRNIQVYAFCAGFVFPPAWLLAGFLLPLPSNPRTAARAKLRDPNLEIETALQLRLLELETRRYANAKWWRRLNRWMTPVGVAVAVIVIVLAVVGTRMGLA